jgi:hypothetical protein
MTIATQTAATWLPHHPLSAQIGMYDAARAPAQPLGEKRKENGEKEKKKRETKKKKKKRNRPRRSLAAREERNLSPRRPVAYQGLGAVSWRRSPIAPSGQIPMAGVCCRAESSTRGVVATTPLSSPCFASRPLTHCPHASTRNSLHLASVANFWLVVIRRRILYWLPPRQHGAEGKGMPQWHTQGRRNACVWCAVCQEPRGCPS